MVKKIEAKNVVGVLFIALAILYVIQGMGFLDELLKLVGLDPFTLPSPMQLIPMYLISLGFVFLAMFFMGNIPAKGAALFSIFLAAILVGVWMAFPELLPLDFSVVAAKTAQAVFGLG